MNGFERDPLNPDYAGPLRIDGAYPYNRHWWPMQGDSYWLYRWHRPADRWNVWPPIKIDIITLDDGTFINGGFTWSPRFTTRAAAVEDRAADILRTARRHCFGKAAKGYEPWPVGRYGVVIRWIAHVCAREARRTQVLGRLAAHRAARAPHAWGAA